MARPQRSVRVSISNDHRCSLSSRAFLCVLAVITIVFAPTQSVAQIITAVSGDTVTIGVGAREGVRIGMTGKIKKQEMVGGSLRTFEIARFEVTTVDASSCTARLIEVGAGWSVEASMDASFDQPLVSAPPTEVPTSRLPKPTPTPQLPSDPVALDLLATAAFEAGQWERSIELYKALLHAVPNEPLAIRRLREAEDFARREKELAAGLKESQVKPAEAGYLMKKGDALMAAGEWALAAKYYARLAEANPEYQDAGAKLTLVRIEEALAESDKITARNEYQKLMAMGIPYTIEKHARSLEARITFYEPGALADFQPLPGMHFRYVPPGEFLMGSSPGDAGPTDEREHRVEITRGFWMGETEVTQGQWRSLMESNPSKFDGCGDNCPVENVTWSDAVDFCNALSRSEGLGQCYLTTSDSVMFVGSSCRGYRLPTEAEWERAARASQGWRFAGSNEIETVAWFSENSAQGPRPVKKLQPNAWGLFDLSGNVWEWCWDRYGDFSSAPTADPEGPERGHYRVFRGGSWFDPSRRCLVSFRNGNLPEVSGGVIGFRVARTED